MHTHVPFHVSHPSHLRQFTLALVGALLLGTFSAAPARAHHAFAAEFDANQPVELHGTVTRVKWVNPHSWLYLDVSGDDGAVTEWAVEFGGPYALLQKGLRKTDFPIGATVSVNGFLAKSGAPVVNASKVLLPDGRDFYTAAEDSPGAGE
ncbi:MAG: hypothetical protein LBE21_02120 [Pseudomonadales bacterium]|jgi:hypothetical protein|nr:hypothetical protein [Pseudomonadales bacterium]